MGMTSEEFELIRRLYQETGPLLFHWASVFFGERAPAEEAVQETFRIACETPQKLAASPSAGGWLMNTLKNVCREAARKRKRQEGLARKAAGQYEETAGPQEADLALLYADIADTKEWEILNLIAVRCYTVPEAASLLGISVKACQKRYERARRKLRKSLKDALR